MKKKVKVTVLGTAALDGSGDAGVTVKPGSVLKKSITILYNGDADFASTALTPPVLTQASLKTVARPMLGTFHRGRR